MFKIQWKDSYASLSMDLVRERLVLKPFVLEAGAYNIKSELTDEGFEIFLTRLVGGESPVSEYLFPELQALCCELGFAGFDEDFAMLHRLNLPDFGEEKSSETSIDLAHLHYGNRLREGRGVVRDYAAAARHFKICADRGNAEGQLRYGECLQYGQGVKKDHTGAANYFKLSADQGNSSGQCFFGQCLFHGRGVERDYVAAAQYFKLSADQGNPQGQLRYGECLMTGRGVPKDEREAICYMKLSAGQGNKWAQMQVGKRLCRKGALEWVAMEGLKYLKRSADQGHAPAQRLYWKHLLRHQLFKDDDVLAFWEFVLHENPTVARRIWRTLINNRKIVMSKAARMFLRGSCLYRGVGVHSHPSAGADFLKEGAELGSVACQRLYRIWFHGDDDLATGYLKQRADQGSAEDQLSYGLYLRQTSRNEESSALAANYFKLSAEQGNAEGQLRYAECLSHGWGVVRDEQSMCHYLKLSADQGNPEAQLRYGQYLRRTDDLVNASHYFKLAASQGSRDALKALRELVNSGSAPGRVRYGECLRDGIGTSRDYTAAANCFYRSAVQGWAEGQLRYAECLFSGRGVKRDLKESAHYFKLGADQGLAEGQFRYGECLRAGFGVSVNIQEAARYFRSSAEQGHSYGQLRYGECLLGGLGVARDVDQACHYFKLSASQQSHEACFYLHWLADHGNVEAKLRYAECLHYGLGTEVNLRAAAQYFKDLIDHGNRDACAGLLAVAESGEPLSQFMYGTCLQDGVGVDRDCDTACRYFKRSASQGNRQAFEALRILAESGNAYGQLYYGKCLRSGWTTDCDLDAAGYNIALSASQGNSSATRRLDSCIAQKFLGPGEYRIEEYSDVSDSYEDEHESEYESEDDSEDFYSLLETSFSDMGTDFSSDLEDDL